MMSKNWDTPGDEFGFDMSSGEWHGSAVLMPCDHFWGDDMRFATAAAAVLLMTSAAAFAAKCSDETQGEARRLSAQYDDLEKELRKVGARADSLRVRNDALPEASRVALPDLLRPSLPEDLFDDDGKLILECDDEGNADDAVKAANDALADAEMATARFADEVDGSREAVSAAETAPKDGADVADGSRGADDQIARVPMPNPKNRNSYRRILTLPDARIFADENTRQSDALTPPALSVHYVFGERQRSDGIWLEVGKTLREGPTGWVRSDDTLDWSTMLVMQFASVGQRERTLFFDDFDTLRDVMDSPQYRREAEEYYETIATEQQRAKDDPNHKPQWDPSLVAIEPDVGLRFGTAPYLLPILEFTEYQFDNSIDSVVLRVAAVPADSGDIGDRDYSTFGVSQSALADQDGVFRIGVTFVIDTTISMAPFIERARDTIKAFYDTFSRYETAQFVSFGIVGFRDNQNNDDRLEYTARVFQYLDPRSEAADVIANMQKIKESQIPTVDFREDVYAGLIAAIEDQEWDPFDARLVVLITDASARLGPDPLALHQGVTEETIVALANQNNIAIIPVHLLTPANKSNGDRDVARKQYEIIAKATGDTNRDSFISVDATGEDEFGKDITHFVNVIAQSLLQINSGQVLSIEEMEPVIGGSDLAYAAANEIFRAQLESLAAVDTGVTPSFLDGWAADRDLTNPDNRMMDVSVYLTRNQLSTLGQKLDGIASAFRDGGSDPETFFDNLQLLAAETATDPDAPAPDSNTVVEKILPSFLEQLPYRSQVLQINQDYWQSLSVAARQELVEGLEEKLRIYQEIENNVDLWKDFGADVDVSGHEITLVPLTSMP